MGVLLKDLAGWYIKKQRSNNILRLEPDKWYLTYHENKRLIVLSQFHGIQIDNMTKIPRYIAQQSFEYTGNSYGICVYNFTHKELEDTTEAPDNMRTSLDIMLMFSDQKHGK